MNTGSTRNTIAVDATKCTGCRCCEFICSFTKSGAFNPKKSRVKVNVLDYVGFSDPVLCLHCSNPACVEACPNGALRKAGGSIIVSTARCDSCGLCVDNCVTGAIRLAPQTGEPLICDLCGGTPQCVEWCPTGALTTAELGRSGPEGVDDTISKAERVLRERGIPETALDWYRQFR